MGLRINLNVAAMSASRYLEGTETRLQKSMERLSSGYTINSAADDPAGLVISEKLRAQTGGLATAIKNAGDGVNMVRTTEAALQEVSTLLRAMRDLAVHASSTGTNDAASIEADQAQIRATIQALNKISDETMFMSKKLLNGDAGVKTTIFTNAIKAIDLGKTKRLADYQVHVNVTQAATKATINSRNAPGGVSAAFPDATAGTMVINGVRVNWPANSTNADVINAINLVSGETNVVASYDVDHIVLTQTKFGSDQKILLEGCTQFAIGGVVKTSAQGLDTRAIVTDGTNIISDSTWASGTGLVLKDSLGNVIVLDEAANLVQNLGEVASAKVGTLTFQVGAYANQLRRVNLSSVHSTQLGIFAIPGKSVADIDLTTFKGAQEAILIIDDAISQMSSLRAELGSLQKQVLESSIRSLGIAKENIQASESTIRDTNMAEEVVEMTRNQILQQAGVAMLTQANQTPMALMSLLK